MDGVEAKRLPEETPVTLNPEGLQDLVQAVGEVVQAIEANGRPRQADCRKKDAEAFDTGKRIRGATLRLPAVESFVSVLIRFCLALWVGGTLLVVLAAPVIFRRIASRDTAGDVFGEVLRRFEAVKHALSLVLVIAVFLQLERTRGFAGQSRVAGIAIFIAVATNVYLAMVVRPRLSYLRMKVGSFDIAAPDDPWRSRFDRLHRRSTRVLVLGWIAAAVALAFAS